MKRTLRALGVLLIAALIALFTLSVRAIAEEAPAASEAEQVADLPEDAAAPAEEQAPEPESQPDPAPTPEPSQPQATSQPASNGEQPASTTVEAPHPNAGDVSPTTINNLTMTWSTPSAPDSVDENGVLQLVANSNNAVSTSHTSYGPGPDPKVARAQLYFDISGSTRHEPGTVEMRIPAHIFSNRNGRVADHVAVAAPEYQNPMPPENENEFAWRLDTHGDNDPSNDEIVFVNVLPLAAASKYVCDISYTIDYAAPVKDGTVSEPLSVSLTISESSGDVDATSNEITATIDTHTDIGNTSKSTASVYEEWQSSWGTKPSDADNYIYTVWRLRGFLGSRNSQPYVLAFQDTPLDHGGQVVGYSDIYVGNSSRTGNWPEATSFHTNPPTYRVDFPIPDSQYGRQNENYSSVCFVLVRYPRSQLNSTGVTQLVNRSTYSLTNVDEGTTESRTATATLSYRKMTFTAPPGNYQTSKVGGSTVSGGIERLLHGKSVTFNYFRNEGYAQGYELTLRSGGNPKNPNDYGKRSYHVEVVDDALFYEDDNNRMELGPGDYQINYVSALAPRVYDYLPDAARGVYTKQENEAGSAKPDVTYYGQFGTDEWVELFTISYKNDARFGTVTRRNTSLTTSVTTYQGSWTIVYLADGCTAVKGTFDTNTYEVDLTMMAEITLFPTERVTSYLQQKVDAAGGESVEAMVTNVNTILVYDDAGNLIDTGARYDGLWGSRIMQRDHTLYGTATGTGVLHAAVNGRVRSYSYGNYTLKSGSVENQPSRKRVKVTYELLAGEYISRASTDTNDSVVREGYFTPQTGGTFYDLLPLGMEPDLNSVYLYSYGRTSDSRLRVVSKEAIENWHGTGRTLLVVTWEKTGEYGPYGGTWGANQTGSMPRLRFDAYYPWEAAEDYGLNPLNSFAYETANESIAGGAPDDARLAESRITEASLFQDMNGDGQKGNGAPTTFIYGQARVNITGLFSSLASLQKHVRMGDSGTWKDGLTEDLTTQAGGTYQYRLRYVTAAGTNSRNIVLYDSLESYKPSRDSLDDVDSWILDRDVDAPTWQGTFAGLDLSQPISRGIAPVVYYSTVDGLDIEANHDLTDTSVWVSAEDYSGDLADVRAVAVDLSTKKDGTPYVLPENQSVLVLVNMVAPTDPHEVNAYAMEGAAAFNQDWVTSTIGSSSGQGQSSNEIIHTEYTRVLLEPGNVDIPVEKVWEDDGNRDGLRPESITVRLKADGELVLDEDGNPLELVLSDENDWQGTFEDLPECAYQESSDPNAGGTWREIEYELVEVETPEGYEFASSGDATGLTGTNTHDIVTGKFPVDKVWEDDGDRDGVRPDTVTVRLLADGEPYLDEDGNEVLLEIGPDTGWEAAFEDIPLYHDGGQAYEFSVEEVGTTDGYVSELTGNAEDGFKLTNTHEIATTSVSVSKAWEDDDNRDGIRPDSVTVRLMADGEPVLDEDGNELTVELSEANGWKATFDDLPMYRDHGQKIEYTVQEVDVPEGYGATVEGNAEDGFTVTNTHEPGTTAVQVSKVWDDGQDHDGIRPDSVTVRLLANGQDTGLTVELNEDNSWTAAFVGLPEKEDGEDVVYTIEEVEVPEGYASEVTGDAAGGFTITNTHEPTPDPEPEPKPTPDTPDKPDKPRVVPKTYDAAADVLPIVVTSLAVLGAGAVLRRRRRED